MIFTKPSSITQTVVQLYLTPHPQCPGVYLARIPGNLVYFTVSLMRKTERYYWAGTSPKTYTHITLICTGTYQPEATSNSINQFLNFIRKIIK